MYQKYVDLLENYYEYNKYIMYKRNVQIHII